jgi:hypothetical protein
MAQDVGKVVSLTHRPSLPHEIHLVLISDGGACNECCVLLSSEKDEKLIELVRKCEELYDVTNKKYSDSVWRERLWGQIDEGVKISGKFQCL